MKTKFDLVIVGAGALGTFHAYHALNAGLSVALLEKDGKPQGSTVRNFGQIVPSGMDAKWQKYGRKSLEIYKQLQQQFDATVRQNGSVYFASNEEEVQLLEELDAINKANDYQSVLLNKKECLERYDGLRNDYVQSGLYFPGEVTVEPRLMIHRVLEYLVAEKQLHYRNNTAVLHCNQLNDEVEIVTAQNEKLYAAKVIICSGYEFKILYPELFATSDLVVTKLQMMQTVPQQNYQLQGSILTGLSIRRYESFHECPSFAAIKAKESDDTPEKKWSVHILFKQAVDGSVIIGDSHEYAAVNQMEELGFDINTDIDEFMLAEARKIIELPDYTIQKKWIGFYTQCKQQDILQHNISNNIHIVTGIGGKGMTASPGFAEKNIQHLFNLNQYANT